MIDEARFGRAVAAMDAGDVASLRRLLDDDPSLAHERLEEPGAWLREQVGSALEDFFVRPYLLWFVAEDPVRTGRLPANAADVAREVLRVAAGSTCIQEQVDYALRLVAWSFVARDCGVQTELIDVLMDAGAMPAPAIADDALVNGNIDAAAHLVGRGAPLTLAAAMCLGRFEEAPAPTSPGDLQSALVLSALNGNATALARLVALGADAGTPSADVYPHATPLHHAVGSGSVEAVRVLIDAGAPIDTKDTAWDGTPIEWAAYHASGGDAAQKLRYEAIARDLRSAADRRRATGAP